MSGAMAVSGCRPRIFFLAILLAFQGIKGVVCPRLYFDGFRSSNGLLARGRRKSVKRLGLGNLAWGKFVATYALDWAYHYATTTDLLEAQEQAQQFSLEEALIPRWAVNSKELDLGSASDTVSDHQYELFGARCNLVQKLFGRYPPVAYVFN